VVNRVFVSGFELACELIDAYKTRMSKDHMEATRAFWNRVARDWDIQVGDEGEREKTRQKQAPTLLGRFQATEEEGCMKPVIHSYFARWWDKNDRVIRLLDSRTDKR